MEAICQAAVVSTDRALPDGVYEQLVTTGLLDRLDGLLTSRKAVDDAEAAGRLGDC